MALLTMQKKNLDGGSEVDVHGRIQKETVTLDRVTVTRVTFGVGARWSEDLKDYAGTESCLSRTWRSSSRGVSRWSWTTAPKKSSVPTT